MERITYRPFSIPNSLRGCNSDLAQYSNTPSLRAAGFEDEDSLPDEASGLQASNFSG